MNRTPISVARADELMIQYARSHRESIRNVDDTARSEGLVFATGRLVYIGARWFLLAPLATSRRFTVKLPGHGSRTVEVVSRARLAVNLCELGYSTPQAGRHAYRAWGQGVSRSKMGNVIAQELA